MLKTFIASQTNAIIYNFPPSISHKLFQQNIQFLLELTPSCNKNITPSCCCYLFLQITTKLYVNDHESLNKPWSKGIKYEKNLKEMLSTVSDWTCFDGSNPFWFWRHSDYLLAHQSCQDQSQFSNWKSFQLVQQENK